MMMMRICTVILCILLTACSATKARKHTRKITQKPAQKIESPFYISIGGLYGIENFDFTDDEDALKREFGGNYSIDADDTLGHNIKTGYRFHDYGAIEIQHQQFTGGDIHVSGGNFNHFGFAEYTGHATTLNLKGYLPHETLESYALVGFGLLYGELQDTLGFGLSVTEQEPTLRFGAGLDYWPNEHCGLNLEISFLVPEGTLESWKMVPITLGLQFRF